FILTCIKENNKITRDEIAHKAGKNKKTIERHLAKMKDKVFYDGSGFSGCWKIIEDK
ncbi:MAG: winged helix-turn-helix domain-containing protein, partial [Treponema sp.]|nr:winged helix-turn-helix domain-containing protein [Treponema sp.]